MISAARGAGKDTGDSDLIPKGQLAFCIIAKAGLTKSQKSGNRYVALELVIDANQPYERRRLWHNVMDFTDAGHSDAAQTMGIADLAKILEVGRNARPDSPESYSINDWSELVGLRCAVKIGIEKGNGEYKDKNRVELITPNPDSSTAKHFANLLNGVFNPLKAKTAGGAGTGSFGQASAPAPQQSGLAFGGEQRTNTQPQQSFGGGSAGPESHQPSGGDVAQSSGQAQQSPMGENPTNWG